MEHISIKCKIKDAIANRVYRWVTKEKMDKAKMEKSMCSRVNMFMRLKKKAITKEQGLEDLTCY